MKTMLAAVFFVATSASGLSAEQAAIDPAANARLGALRKSEQANGYRRLFELRDNIGTALDQQARSQAPAPKRKIVCGMTVIEVGPELDPKMGVTPPNKDSVTFAVRAVPPPICGAAR